MGEWQVQGQRSCLDTREALDAFGEPAVELSALELVVVPEAEIDFRYQAIPEVKAWIHLERVS